MRWSTWSVALCLCLLSGCSQGEGPGKEPERRIPEPTRTGPSPSPSPPRPVLRTATPTPAPSATADSSPSPAATVAHPDLAREPRPRSTLALRLPPAQAPSPQDERAASNLWEQAESSGMASDYRKAGEKALSLHLYNRAVASFRKEAAIYRSKGLPQAALAQESRAREYDTRLSLYLSDVPSKSSRAMERLEPESGCYIGAFIDRDANLKQFMEGSQTHGDVDQFNTMMKKRHSSFFMYRSYGQPFPTAWAEYLKERDAIVHIAWEPKSLEQVRDDAYLRQFVDELVALDHPVMLRFASEMNGEWTPYHGNPEAYKTAFRLIHQATRRAPKVAVMWCPNTVPREGLEAYYPGDQWVDWVGVNFYSVPFMDNDRSRPGERVHPTDQLQAVYDLYAARKPIAIGEWAASRESKAKPGPMTPFAKGKISQLYATLPTRYPRVKMVNWYDSNNLVQASPSRQLNNYQVTAPADLRNHYARAVASDYYLAAGKPTAGLAYREIQGRTEVAQASWFRISLQPYEPNPKVYFRLNGNLVLATADALDWRLGPENWVEGKNVVEVSVYDRSDRLITQAKAALDR